LLEHSAIRSADLDDQDDRVPLSRYLALMNASIALCNDPALALKFGQVIRTEELSVAFSIAGTTGTVDEARSQVNRFARLIDDGNGGKDPEVLRYIKDRDGAWLVFNTDGNTAHRYLQETGIAWCVRETRRTLKDNHGGGLFPKAIYFNYEEPSYRREYDRIFGVPLFFGSTRTAMLVDDGFLELRMPSPNPYVTKVLSDHAERLLKQLEASRTMRGKVERSLIPMLRTGGATVEAVARNLGLSRQTLFRRLKGEGLTFAQILDELRRGLALDYLRKDPIPVSEVARLLGFSESAAFSRAFKRWTGLSPRAARNAARKPPG
jgi:AraC-like DNA-binding protein